MGRANAFSAAFKDHYYCPKGCGRKSKTPELAEKHGGKVRLRPLRIPRGPRRDLPPPGGLHPSPPNPLGSWRPKVCRQHETYLQSPEVKVNGRDWEWLEDLPSVKKGGES